MNRLARSAAQQGAVMVVAMLFLLVVTIISVVAARNSTFTAKMSSNLQDSYSSFQSAEAGVLAIQLLTGTANDPLDRADNLDPFNGIAANEYPLRKLNDAAVADSMNVDVLFTGEGLGCPRSNISSSENQFVCDYYRVESEHAVTQRARTSVKLGVVKTLIGSSSP